MYADPTKRAPKAEPDVIPAQSHVVLTYRHTGLSTQEREETNLLLQKIAEAHLLTRWAGEVASSHDETVLSWRVPSTVGITAWERALSYVHGVSPIGYTFGPVRLIHEDEPVATVA